MVKEKRIRDLTHSEVKLARKILTRHNLTPPYNLRLLVESYANLYFEELPFEADGITVDVKSNKPDIYIDSNLSLSRKNFTIAHELGHIIIPWHIGTIISNPLNYSAADHFSYRTLEAEANRFASELLMPSDWVKTILSKSILFEDKINEIKNLSQCSLDAVLIKIDSLCEDSRYILIVDQYNICREQYSCNTPAYIDFKAQLFNQASIPHLSNLETLTISNKTIYTFTVGHYDPSTFTEEVDMTWQELIKNILNDLNIHEPNNRTLLRINAVLGNKIHDYHDKSIEETCNIMLLRYEGRGLDHVTQHQLFPVYIRKRIEELKEKYEQKK
ncbi:ImmA/IrrE family metallo-endopeptidase [Acinetobacter bohemicus]|uniref:ImmA/IrrE family metallo-endopeptidase n=1 Tax=Acinetobacter bohemicus TaxID=1435036 RepID=UPI003FA1B371